MYNLVYPKKLKFFTRIRQLMFLKMGMFCKKMITFSSSGHLMEKSTFLPKISFFLNKTDIFARKLIVRETLVTLPQKFAQHDFITVLKNSLIYPKTNAFCINWHFFPKENDATKNWHFSKTKDTFFRKLNISTRN